MLSTHLRDVLSNQGSVQGGVTLYIEHSTHKVAYDSLFDCLVVQICQVNVVNLLNYQLSLALGQVSSILEILA